MKTYSLYKNGLHVTDFEFDLNSTESLKKKCINLSNTNVNCNYNLTVEFNGKVVRSYKNF